MKRLHRKIFIELCQSFTLAFFAFLIIILLGRALQLREMLFGLELNFVDTILIFVYLSPYFLQFVLPISCMLAIFLTFIRMGSDREIIALRAGGLSLYNMLTAPAIFSVLCAILCLWVSLFLLGWGMNNFRVTVMDIASNKAKLVIQPGVFNKNIPGFVLYAKQVDPISGSMAELIIDNTVPATNSITILAPSGKIETDTARAELIFRLANGKIYNISENANSNVSTVLAFDEYLIRLPLSDVFQGLDLGQVRPREMSWAELNKYTPEEFAPDSPRMQNKLVVERHKRFIFAFACIVLCFLTIPLAISLENIQKQTGTILALTFFFIYYSLLTMGISLGESGSLSPYISLWLPNFIILILSFVAIYLTNKGNIHLPQLNIFKNKNNDQTT